MKSINLLTFTPLILGLALFGCSVAVFDSATSTGESAKATVVATDASLSMSVSEGAIHTSSQLKGADIPKILEVR